MTEQKTQAACDTVGPSVGFLYWFVRRRFLFSALSFAVVLATDVATLVDVALGPRAITGFGPNLKGYAVTAGLFIVTEGAADVIRALRGVDRGYPWESSYSYGYGSSSSASEGELGVEPGDV